jgi:transcriptional regulator of arginine metabolism
VKNARQAEILSIIQSAEVETQEQLLAELKKRGFLATQATISRDIKELRLVKELTGRGGYRYIQTDRKAVTGSDVRLRNIFKEGVISVDVAQNIVVVRTMPGLASAACSALDGMDIPGMMGSLAGDDTGILIMRDSAVAQQFNSEVHKLLR